MTIFYEILLATARQSNKYKQALTNTIKAKPVAIKSIRDRLAREPITLIIVIGATELVIGVVEYIAFRENLGGWVIGLAERFRRELIPIVEFIRREAKVITNKENYLLQLY